MATCNITKENIHCDCNRTFYSNSYATTINSEVNQNKTYIAEFPEKGELREMSNDSYTVSLALEDN